MPGFGKFKKVFVKKNSENNLSKTDLIKDALIDAKEEIPGITIIGRKKKKKKKK